jgi:DNA-binding MarR family transcriptional regulator
METCDTKKILPKLVYLLKRSLDEWKETSLCCSNQSKFNRSQLPLFMSIGTEGISNNELAANLNITKQAASKVIKELEELKLVRNEPCSTDARSVTLYLTDEGVRLYQHIKNQIEVLETQYKKLVGAKNYEIAVDVMAKLINFHEERNKVALN